MVKIHLSGRITMVGRKGTVDETDLPGVQGRLIVAVLALERRPIARDTLAEWLWPRDRPADYVKSLNPLISKIRQQLTRLEGDDACSVRSMSGCFEMVAPAGTWIDVEDAITRLDRAEGAFRRGDHGAAWADATVSVSILRRDLLPGCESDWVDARRADLLDRQCRGWLLLGTIWLERGDHTLARSAARSAIQLDPYREECHRLLIRAELDSGNRALAARAARECRDLLRRDLGVDPSQDTVELERLIRG